MSRLTSTYLSAQIQSSKGRHVLEPIEEDDHSMDIEDSPLKKSRCRAETIGYESPNPKCADISEYRNTCDTYQQLSSHYKTENRPIAQINSDIHLNNTIGRLDKFRYFNFLEIHQITEKFRAKMFDWMIEVLKTFNQKEATIYRSMFLLDFFYHCSTNSEIVEDLHLTGIACMMIASKCEEINFIKVDAFLETIGKNKFTKEDLLRRELEVLDIIQFKTYGPTIYDLLKCCFQVIDIKNDQLIKFIESCTLMLTKICLFSYQLLNNIPLTEIALFCLIIALKMAEKTVKFDTLKEVSLKD